MSHLKKTQFRFRKHDNVGAEGAEQDVEYLRDCFVDTGDLDVLRDTRDPKRIVVGRTGAGKSALLLLLARTEERVATIEPDQLALSYLVNSTVLKHLDALGVNLDLFYRLLWRHIFAVELIQLRYSLRCEADQRTFFERIRNLFAGDRRKDEAMKYLLEWGEHFWKDTEYRIHEVTAKFETDVKASLGAKVGAFEGSIGAADALSVEDKKDIVHRAQEVVNRVQIQKLAQVIDILASDVFNDPQQRYYVLIDRLDEHWVPELLRYKLIRALIEAVRDLQKITNAKLVVAIRRDLLQRVFRETRDAGFQEEKYQSLYLPLLWTQDQLMQVLEKRLNKLVRNQYSSSAGVTWSDIFPERVGQTSTSEYLVARTLYRPRDIIQFCNCCIELSTDRPAISAQNIKDAETKYSRLRFRGLGDEWAADFPELLDVAEILKRRPPTFSVDEISEKEMEAYCEKEFDGAHPSRLQLDVKAYVDNRCTLDELRARLIEVFYDVGLVGIRPEPSRAVSWSFRERDVLRAAEITGTARVVITPVFHSVLATETRGGSAAT